MFAAFGAAVVTIMHLNLLKLVYSVRRSYGCFSFANKYYYKKKTNVKRKTNARVTKAVYKSTMGRNKDEEEIITTGGTRRVGVGRAK